MATPAANWAHCLEHAALSNVGLRRANNQDSMAVVIAESQETWLRRGHLFMVADGMGAHAAGELASKLATDVVPLAYYKLPDRTPSDAILNATQDANSQIHSRGQATVDFRGMGTTCTALLLLAQGAVVSHVGDSRAYRLRGNRLEQLTFDHSLVWEMRAAGQIPDEDAPNYIPKNIITRSLGPNPAVQVDLEGPFPIEVGDTFLLCSDGLSGPVKDEELAAVLVSMPPHEAVQALVDLANLRGGPDNITVIVVRVTGPLSARPGEDASAAGDARPVHPAVWTLLGIATVAAFGLAMANHFLAALAALGFVAAIVMAVMILRQRNSPSSGMGGRQLGRGPYRACAAAADGGFADQVAGIIDQLRDAAVTEQWSIDWSRFDSLQQRAAAARKAGQFATAIRESFQQIRLMLESLKQQKTLGT